MSLSFEDHEKFLEKYMNEISVSFEEEDNALLEKSFVLPIDEMSVSFDEKEDNALNETFFGNPNIDKDL